MVLLIGQCGQTQADGLLLSLFILIPILLLLIGLTKRIGWMVLLSGIFFLILSWYLAGCIAIISVIIACIGVYAIIHGALMK